MIIFMPIFDIEVDENVTIYLKNRTPSYKNEGLLTKLRVAKNVMYPKYFSYVFRPTCERCMCAVLVGGSIQTVSL